MALTFVAGLVLAPVAGAQPTISGITEGAIVTSIPPLTIDSNTLPLPKPTVDVTLAPTGELNATGAPLPLMTGAVPAVSGSYTLTVTENTLAALSTTVHFTVDATTPGPPTVLSGPLGITGPSGPFTFSWSLPLGATSAHWQLLDFATLLSEGDVAAPMASVTIVPVLAPGDRTVNFRVALRNVLGNQSAYSSWPPLVVDQTPPGVPVALAGPVGPTTDTSPSFAWQGTELGGTFEWDVTDSAGKSIFAPGTVRTTTRTSVTTPTLALVPNALHRLKFHVRQVDPYGNRGPERILAFTITTLQERVALRFAKLMTPAAGRTVTSLRPMLRWSRVNRGTTIFNIQIWSRGRRVLSRFPHRTLYKVPKGMLKPGRQYAWYIFSFVGQKQQPRRMTSYFFTKG